jgi:3D (Asp-Asp-Asp) domain-containing protein
MKKIPLITFIYTVGFIAGMAAMYVCQSTPPTSLIPTRGDIQQMDVSAYCKESCCCGKWADGITASGKPAKGFICAAPPNYPFGTKFIVNGVVWTCEDRGGAIKGNKLDLLMSSHQSALNWGRQEIEVTVIGE